MNENYLRSERYFELVEKLSKYVLKLDREAINRALDYIRGELNELVDSLSEGVFDERMQEHPKTRLLMFFLRDLNSGRHLPCMNKIVRKLDYDRRWVLAHDVATAYELDFGI